MLRKIKISAEYFKKDSVHFILMFIVSPLSPCLILISDHYDYYYKKWFRVCDAIIFKSFIEQSNCCRKTVYLIFSQIVISLYDNLQTSMIMCICHTGGIWRIFLSALVILINR